MRIPFRTVLLALTLFVATPCFAAVIEGTQQSGAAYRIYVPPSGWNGELVVYAHGYVEPTRPIAIPEDQLVVNGISIPNVVTGLRYAFAVSSFSTNGLAIREGLADCVDLVDIFSGTVGQPSRVYIVGVSGGGLIATQAAEQYPDVFDGALEVCGPIGSFQDQVNYLADFRTLANYYFPGIVPGNYTSVPSDIVNNVFLCYVYFAAPYFFYANSFDSLVQLILVGQYSLDYGDIWNSLNNTLFDLYRYNVVATEDAVTKLGGQPYDNTTRNYTGSNNDAALNAGVQRVAASPAAINEIQLHYETTGDLQIPLVAMHTTQDHQVPFSHIGQYMFKVASAGKSANLSVIPAERYGHCTFTAGEFLFGFFLMLSQVD